LTNVTMKKAQALFLSAAFLVAPFSTASFAQSEPAEFVNLLRSRVLIEGSETRYTLEERMARYNVPGLSLAVIDDGEIVYSAGFGLRQAEASDLVDADTVFSAGSVSKISTAMLVLTLANEGVLDLDAPVLTQLRSWSLPTQPEFDQNRVTLRTILSHTSGFNMHGFRDFQPGESLPSTIETLEGQSPAVNDPLTLTFEPGSAFRYSGGGYTLAQLIVDDTDNRADFDAIADEHLFTPLGMSRSRFTNPLPLDHGNIAFAHDDDGNPVARPRGYEAFPESAASGLWTSANDLGGMIAALLSSYRSDGGYLPRPVVQDMMTQVSPSEHGLGPRLEGRGSDFIFHHGGVNNSYHAWIEGHLATGDGLVILNNGANGSDLNTEIRNAVSDAMNWQINQPIRIPEIHLSSEQLESFTGSFSADSDYPHALRRLMNRGLFERGLSIQTNGKALTMTVEGNDGAIALIPMTPNRFWIEGFGLRTDIAELEFHRNAHGETEAMTFHLVNASLHYVRD